MLDKELIEYVEREVLHLKELMEQHDKLTALAIEKSENAYNERFAKTNEFREQQNDLIQTFAKADEMRSSFAAADAKFEANLKSTTDRFESGQTMIMDKIEGVRAHLNEKIAASVTTGYDKFITLNKQMQALIDSNAAVSNKAISDLNKWKDSITGSIRVLMTIGGFISALVIALTVAFVKTLF